MGKQDGFLLYDRKDNKARSPKERVMYFNEFHIPIKEEERKKQAARCMNCGVPYCQSALKLNGMVTGCPLHNLIPEWNDAVYQGNVAHALARLLKTSSFPEFTSRVCPSLCEKACLCGVHDSPVTVHENEYYIIETAFEKGLMTPRIPNTRSGKKVAIIGSGPAGLAAADRLNRRGHTVEVFERDDRIGGLLMYGIPNMKLEKHVVERRQKLMEAEGVVFHTSTDVGKDISAKEIMNQFDCVILACGAKQARKLNVEGIDSTKGVMMAVDFLKATTVSLLEGTLDKKENRLAEGKHVVIVGGGDTGNDCVGTCIRENCASVVQLEMMTCPPLERSADNPWPQWPKVVKTDYGQEEAIERFGHDPRIYETTVKRLISEKGVLKQIETVKVTMVDGKLQEVKGSEKIMDCDLLITAAGFTGCQSYIAKAFGVSLSNRNTVVASDDYMTDQKGIFTCGDMHRGQSLVVWAIDEGRRCARSVDAYLMGYTNLD